MIIVRLTDGMGNHLFQYAAARRLALLKHVPLKMDCTRIPRGGREYRFNHFNIRCAMATDQEINAYLPRGRGIFRGLQRDFYRLRQRRIPLEQRILIEEPHFHYDPNFLRASGNNYLTGYRQSERYFADIADTLREEYRIITEPDAENQALLDIITGCTSVALHVRRGDYLSEENLRIHGVCSLDYYRAAVDQLQQRVEHPHLFVFSDDIPWTREHLHFDLPMTYVDLNDARRDYEDLRLMSHCRHHIIANSSFSWWGAWLAEWPGQIVIAPQPWFCDQRYDTRDIVPERWLKVDITGSPSSPLPQAVSR